MRKSLIALGALSVFLSAPLMRADDTADRMNAAADLLTDMMHASDKGVPQDLMNKADCIVLVPGLKKAAFVVGAKYGRGFAVCRRENGSGWSAPAGIRVEGGSFGFQVGGSEQDVLLLVMNQTGMKHLLNDKFTLGGEATVSAGPVGRDASAQTDAVMRAEMLSWSRSRGLFAGVSLEGATLRPDADANRDLYGHSIGNREILTTGVPAPQQAARLESLLDRNSLRKTR